MRTQEAWTAAILSLGLAIVLGCEPAPQPTAPARGRPSSDYRTETGSGRGDTQRQRQAALLNRLRVSDPEFRVIERAIFNEENDLGIIVDRSVAVAALPRLMRSLLAEMAREFPGEDLTIVAYAPTDPPMPIGTARLNARTRDMTYTPAQRNY
jgi:hypothetical protein